MKWRSSSTDTGL